MMVPENVCARPGNDADDGSISPAKDHDGYHREKGPEQKVHIQEDRQFEPVTEKAEQAEQYASQDLCRYFMASIRKSFLT
jgi:hypothetical protein